MPPSDGEKQQVIRPEGGKPPVTGVDEAGAPRHSPLNNLIPEFSVYLSYNVGRPGLCLIPLPTFVVRFRACSAGQPSARTSPTSFFGPTSGRHLYMCPICSRISSRAGSNALRPHGRNDRGHYRVRLRPILARSHAATKPYPGIAEALAALPGQENPRRPPKRTRPPHARCSKCLDCFRTSSTFRAPMDSPPSLSRT